MLACRGASRLLDAAIASTLENGAASDLDAAALLPPKYVGLQGADTHRDVQHQAEDERASVAAWQGRRPHACLSFLTGLPRPLAMNPEASGL